MSGGTGERIKRYYSGVCQFVKLALSFDAALVRYACDAVPKVDVALVDGARAEDNVVVVAPDVAVESLAGIVAVGVVAHPNPCFTASTMSKEFFISTGNREGAALSLVTIKH